MNHGLRRDSASGSTTSFVSAVVKRNVETERVADKGAAAASHYFAFRKIMGYSRAPGAAFGGMAPNLRSTNFNERFPANNSYL